MCVQGAAVKRAHGWCLPELLPPQNLPTIPAQPPNQAVASSSNQSGSSNRSAGLGSSGPTTSSTSMLLKDLRPYYLEPTEGAVTNDVELGNNVWLLTGANMAGKSTVLRSIAAASLLGLCGLMVPAKHARIPAFDSIMLRNFSGDSPVEGKSSFRLEMEDTRCADQESTARSLVLADELGKGTEVDAGTAVCAALATRLAHRGTTTVFATHLHKLVDLLKPLAEEGKMEYMRMGLQQNPQGKLLPTWRVEKGVCFESLAFNVAEDSGMDPKLLDMMRHFYDRILAEAPAPGKESPSVRTSSSVNSRNSSDVNLDSNRSHLLSSLESAEGDSGQEDEQQREQQNAGSTALLRDKAVHILRDTVGSSCSTVVASAKSDDSSSSSSSSSSKRQGTPVESEQFQGGAGPAQPSPSTPVLSSPLLTSSSFLGGASLLGWFSSPVAALSRVLEQDLNRLEEEAVIAEAQRIAAGEEGEPTPGAGLASFVGRLPLEAAYRVMCRRPQQFDLVVTGTDARLAKAAMGKQAMLDLHAGTDDKWLFKIKDEDNQEVSHEASESDEDMAMGHRTPVFTIPGVHLALRLQGGTPVHLSPTFLSIAQLHTFTQTAKTLAGRIWLSSRASQREQLRNRVEAVAIALAGNGTLADGASGSGKARGGSSLDEDEDEEGFGDPPEAKQLLAELGEGRAGGLGPSLPPATGVVGFLNAVAVGAITFIGQATTSFANGVDRLMLASPLGLAASGVPKHLIVRAGYLEDMVAELAAENRRQRQRLEVVPLAATLQAESQAQGQIVPQTLPLQQQQQQHSHPSTSLVEQPLPQQPQQQPQQQETLLALPSPVPQTPPLSQQPLESQMGLGMVLQALWAVMHNTTTGDGKLAALLASNWLGTTKISAPKHGELSAVLAIQIKSQLASPAALPPHISTPPASSPRAKDNPHDSSAALGPTAATSSTDAASSQSERAPKLPPSDSTSGAHGHDQRPSTNAAPSLGQEAPMLPPSDTTSGTSSHNQRSQGAPSTTVVDASSGSDLSPHTHSSASAPQPSTSSSRSSRGEEAMDRDGEGKGEQGSSPQSSSSNAARHLSSSSSSSSNNNRSSNGRSNSIQVLKQPAAQTHKFEVGLHINLHDALGSDWEDSESEALEGDEGGELEGARPGKDRGRDKSVVVGDEVRAASEHTEHGRDGLGKAGQSRGAQSKRSVGQLEQRAKQGQQETPQQDRTLGHTESEGRTAGHAEGAGRTAGHGESAEKTAGRTESEKGAAGHAKSEESTAGQLEQRAKEGQQDAPQLGEGQRSGSSGGDAAPSAAAETSQQVDADAAGKGEGLLEGTQGALDQQVADGGRRRRPRQPSITNKEAAYQGLLLMSDLGLQKDEDEQPWRAPPLAFANLGVLMQEMERCRRK
uniref:DNA mismatch repair proteins mutS family domain-containing protein n=1 Tax=Dunaliella tertiolecta TaxID=3047 RepID=A0A7S3R3A2_DUNTE